jgi:hypothetical protein
MFLSIAFKALRRKIFAFHSGVRTERDIYNIGKVSLDQNK